MPKIPLYQHTPQASAPRQVRADPGMFDGQNAAASRVGQAVAGLGQLASEYAINTQQNLKRADDYRHSVEFKNAMESTWNEFQKGLNPDSDPSQWEQTWQKQLDGAVTKALPKTATADLRNKLNLDAQTFKVNSTGQIGMQAKANMVEKASKAGEARSNALWEAGDIAGAEANYREMASLGVIHSEAIPELMRKGQVRVQQNQATRLINTDPIAAVEMLNDRTEGGKPRNFEHLDENDRYALTTQAERNASQLRATSYQELTGRMTNGEVISKTELDGMVEKKLLTATQAKDLMRQQKSGKLDVNGFADLATRITNYSPGDDSTQTEYASLFAEALSFPEAARSSLLSTLNKKKDPKDRLNSPASRDILQRAESEYREGLFLPWADVTKTTGGFFGIGGTEKTVRTQPAEEDLKAWKAGTLDKGVRDAANLAYANYLEKMRSYIDANPDAKDSELETYSQQLKRPYVVAAVSAAIDAQTRPALTPADQQALEWANKNPTDPRAVKIKQRLGQ